MRTGGLGFLITWMVGSAAGATGASATWGSPPATPEGVRRVKAPRPRYMERHDALMEAQDLLGMWRRESQDFVAEVEELERKNGPGIQIFRGEPADPPPDPEPEEAQPGSPGAVAAPREGAAHDDAVRAPGSASWLEEELARREEGRAALAARTAEERERERQWNEAAERRAAERSAAIEAEARRMQEELNRARRREEEQRARQLGGSLDREGNYVDPDLEDEEPR